MSSTHSLEKKEEVVSDANTLEQGPEKELQPFTDEEEARLNKIYRKLDIRIIPALWCMYFLTSFGSSAYGNTLTMNAEKGHSLVGTLKLSSKDISTASALYYVGYIIFDVPMNIAMTRLAPQAWLSRIVFSVGLVYICYASLQNAAGLKAVRMFSGICGAGTWPGLSYYVSLWYPPHRMTRRIGYYFTAAQLSASAAGLVAAGFQKMDMTRGLEGWRWLYIVYGAVTIAVSLSLLIWLPDNEEDRKPMFSFMAKLKKLNPHPLSEEEKILHKREMDMYRIKIQWGWKDVWNILIDPRIWPLIMMYFGVVGTGFGLAVFGTTLIRAVLNVSSISVSLLYAPIWLFDLAAILLITPLSDMFKRFRPLIFSCACVVIMVGLVVTTFAHPKWSRYGGLLIAGFGLGPTVPTCMSMTADTFNKRHGAIGVAVSAALVSGLGNLGSVVCTYALYSGWPADKARQFKYSNMMMFMICGVSIISASVSVLMGRMLGDYKKK